MSLELEREEVVQQLCAHYAQDHLSTGELEARFERVYKAADRSALRTVLEGLPAAGPLVAPTAPLYDLAPTGVPARPPRRMLALFSSIEKVGRWSPGPRAEGTAVLGSIMIDLREAEIPAEGIDMELSAYLGSVEILLPPGIGADVDCSAFMGSIVDKSHAAPPGAPRIRVTGDAFMGSIEVKTKLPKKARMESWREQMKTWFGV
ncbi:MAG: DUF1707 SHOCT-like domain-containing protein [Gemmatimonadaceae bacterium]